MTSAQSVTRWITRCSLATEVVTGGAGTRCDRELCWTTEMRRNS
ncbi:MAG: hypothetical protein QOG05_4761 [Streptosporangiaceae bacterium]|jgi:hypothetical protein|nr:hypothetical protein [Streptosporangiaceae bacterium]